MVKNFNHACILVKDLDRSLKFYKDILGLKIDKIRTIEGKYPQTALGIKGIKLTYVKLRCPNQPKASLPHMELHCWKNPKTSSKKIYNHISFTVKNIDYAYKRLKKAKVKFISKPVRAPHGHSKICFGYDPDSNLIEFVEELKR